MSTAWAKGSTRSWRQLRAYVLDRDGWRCQVPIRQPIAWDEKPDYTQKLRVCNRFADTAGHIVPKSHGGQDQPANLRAECRACNYGEGGRLAHAVRATIRRWTW